MLQGGVWFFQSGKCCCLVWHLHVRPLGLVSKLNSCLFISLHERPISSPIGMDAVIYAAQLSSSFFSSLALAVEGFLDLFDTDSSKLSGSDDDTSLNSKSMGLGGGKRIPSGALSAIVLWCDSELA
jgi:hypothetical protein